MHEILTIMFNGFWSFIGSMILLSCVGYFVIEMTYRLAALCGVPFAQRYMMREMEIAETVMNSKMME